MITLKQNSSTHVQSSEHNTQKYTVVLSCAIIALTPLAIQNNKQFNRS